MRRFLEELGVEQENYVPNCDSQSEIHLAKNISFDSKTKNIHVIYHWNLQVLDDGIVQLEKIHTEDNLVDMLTNIFPRDKEELCKTFVGIMKT
jgi:hypothetical protein